MADRGGPSEAGGRKGGSWRGAASPGVRKGAAQGGIWKTPVYTSAGTIFRRFRLAVVSLLTLGMIAGFLVYLFFLPSSTPLLVITITNYAAPIPPNAWASEDAERFSAAWRAGSSGWFGNKNNVSVTPLTEPWLKGSGANSALDSLKDNVKKLRPGGPNKDVVLIYISAHGVLLPDKHGKASPYLLLQMPETAGAPWDPHREPLPAANQLPVLSVADMLDTINDALPPDIKKVVLLDSSRLDTAWELGVLYNGFNESLADVVAQPKIKNLVVINSAGPGEIGWTSPGMQASVFGYFVCEGLQGAADQDGGNRDGKVSLFELRDYLQRHVDDWAYSKRNSRQRPMLLPENADDFSLAHCQDSPATPAPPNVAATSSSDIEQLGLKDQALWEAHQELSPTHHPASADRIDLVAWAAYEQGLLRWEQLCVAGSAYTQQARDLEEALTALAGQLRSPPPAGRLPEALAFEQLQLAESQQKTIKEFDKLAQQPAATPALELQRAAWELALKQSTPQDLTTILRSVPVQSVEPIEIRFLRLLRPAGGYLPDDAKQLVFLQPALANRNTAEQAAACGRGQYRLQYWLRGPLRIADADRRQAEDSLFVGSADQLSAAKTSWDKADAAYRQAAARSQKVAEAFRVRDRAWLELPYLARWLIDHDPRADQHDADLEDCLKTIQNNLQLASELDRLLEDQRSAKPGAAPAAASDVDKVRALAATVEEGLDNMHQRFDEEFQSAFTETNDKHNARRALDLLSVPLGLTPEADASSTNVRKNDPMRVALFNRYLESVSKEDRSTPDSAGRTASDTSIGNARLKRLQSLRLHPAAAMLGIETSSDAAASGDSAIKQLTREGGEIFARLVQMRANLAAAKPRSGDAKIAAADRGARSAADRDLRMALTFFPWSPRFQPLPERELGDPAGRLRQFDQNEFVLWQTERVLEDFWGSDGGPHANAASATPFFATLADDYLRFLADKELDTGQQTRLQDLRDKSSDLIEAARKLKVAATPVGRVENDQFTAQVNFQAEKPPGTAALWASDKAQQAIKVSSAAGPMFDRLAWPVKPGASAAPFTCQFHLDKSQIEGDQELWRLKMTGFFRGHVVESPLEVSKMAPGHEVVFQPAEVKPPQIVVTGEAKKAGYVTIILDCSGSMGTYVDAEKRPTDSGRRTRMTVAQAALNEALSQLADAKQHHVSLWFYGHRWKVVGPDKGPYHLERTDFGAIGRPRERERLAAEEEKQGINPSNDVQRVWPPFDRIPVIDEKARAEMEALVKNAEPSGYTPLYLAVWRAIHEDMAGVGPDVARQIIVLTDGADFVTPPVNSPGGKLWEIKTPKSDINVREALKGTGIELEIIGCALKPTKDEALEMAQFKRVVGADHFFDATQRAEDVGRYLKSILRLSPYQYTVSDVANHASIVDGAEFRPTVTRRLKEPVDVRVPVGEREAYLVQIVGASAQRKLWLEGGESIQLKWLEENGKTPRLVHFRYQRGKDGAEQVALQEHVLNPGFQAGGGAAADGELNPEQFYVAAYTPDWNRFGKEVKFPVSIQNQNEENFSPRPAEIWAEVQPQQLTPQGPQAQGEPYFFSDLSWLPERLPVPVLQLDTLNWPDKADSAQVKLWFKMRRTKPDVTKLLGDVLSTGVELESPRGKTKFEFKIDELSSGHGYQVVVIERQPPGMEPCEPTKVEIVPQAAITRRLVYPGDRQVRHTFEFPNAANKEALLRSDLTLTTSESLKREAVHPGVLTVPVPLR